MSESEKSRTRRNFSLGKLVVGVLLLSAGGSLIYMRGEIDRLQQDNRNLAQQTGKLYITDNTKIHVFAPLTLHRLEPFGNWHWRIYLPPGRKYLICSKIGAIEPEENPVANDGMPAVGGEFTLDVRLQQNDGKWEMVLTAGPYSESHEFEGPLPNFIKTKVDENQYYAGFFQVEKFSSDKPPVLLRAREFATGPTGKAGVHVLNPNPCPGFVIWLQEDPDTKK